MINLFLIVSEEIVNPLIISKINRKNAYKSFLKDFLILFVKWK